MSQGWEKESGLILGNIGNQDSLHLACSSGSRYFCRKKMNESPAVGLLPNTKLPTIFLLLLLSLNLFAPNQVLAQKKVTDYSQSWYSVSTILRFSDHWGMVGDLHLRLDDFMADNYFYLVIAFATYYISGKYPVVAGLAHLWQAPPDGSKTWGNENRIFEQWSGTQKEGIVTILNRIRFEQRWKDQIVNDQVVGNKVLTYRLRYLASFEARPFKNPKIPGLVVSDEAFVQFGESIVYNTFDQNRLFFGLKQSLTKKLSFDIGYLNILQQKSSGNSYTASHLFRLFFYYNADLRKQADVK